MSSPGQAANLSQVPCPFCALLCDDLVLSQENGQLHIEKNGCPKSVAGFERPSIESSPRIRGNTSTLNAAVATATSLLRSAHRPFFGGLGTDVAGVRAVLALADRTGGVVDHMLSEGGMRNVLAMQVGGWINTTLSEIKNRADLLVFAGTDVIRDFPRFFERVVWNKRSLFDLNPVKRDLVYLGRGLDTKPGISPKGRKPLHIESEPSQLGELALTLRALLKGEQIRSDEVAGVKRAELASVLGRMKQARYGVLVWEPGQLTFPHADLAVQSLCDLVKDLNQHTRFAGFTLAGNEGGVTASSVCAWQAGYPLRTSFARGYPEYDPWRYSTQGLVSNGETDLLVWLSSFTTTLPPETKVPTVVLGLAQMQFKTEPEVFIPVATPGIESTGQFMRCDNVVSLPLRKLRESSLPTAQSVLNAIQRAL